MEDAIIDGRRAYVRKYSGINHAGEWLIANGDRPGNTFYYLGADGEWVDDCERCVFFQSSELAEAFLASLIAPKKPRYHVPMW